MKLSYQRQQQLTACIAILAILLLFVAPVVSKSLMYQQMQAMDADASAHSAMMSHHDMTMMPGMKMHGSSSSAMLMGDHSMMDEGQFACGYCELLVHVPLVFWAFIPIIWLLLIITRAPPPRCIVARVIARRCRCQHPRAPPKYPVVTPFHA